MKTFLSGHRRLVAVTALTLFALTACGGGSDPGASSGANAGSDPVKGLSTPAKISVVTAK
ncbi:MAG: hypothetical protein R3E68_16295 [Burkholderiaceae bacterium]